MRPRHEHQKLTLSTPPADVDPIDGTTRSARGRDGGCAAWRVSRIASTTAVPMAGAAAPPVRIAIVPEVHARDGECEAPAADRERQNTLRSRVRLRSRTPVCLRRTKRTCVAHRERDESAVLSFDRRRVRRPHERSRLRARSMRHGMPCTAEQRQRLSRSVDLHVRRDDQHGRLLRRSVSDHSARSPSMRARAPVCLAPAQTI